MSKELFAIIKERLLNKESLVLAAVTSCSGSTPRGAGALMLAGKGKDGAGERLWGSIGGGYQEHLAIKEAARLLEGQHTKEFSAKKYILHSDDAANTGARCGGDAVVFSRLLSSSEPGLHDVVEKGIASFAGGKAAWLIMEVPPEASLNELTLNELTLNVPGEGAANNNAALFSLGIAAEDGSLCFTAAMPAESGPLLQAGPVWVEEGGKYWFSAPLVSIGFVYVFGGGHVAQELVPLLAHLGFRCIVFDDRKEFTEAALFPDAEKIIHGDFENIGKYLRLTEWDYAVIVTRGHLWDLEAWAFALGSSAAYIGIIGSRTKHEFVKAQLRERGFDDASIGASRVHAPIGLDIKSETPAEIAVSIAGELILCRAESGAKG